MAIFFTKLPPRVFLPLRDVIIEVSRTGRCLNPLVDLRACIQPRCIPTVLSQRCTTRLADAGSAAAETQHHVKNNIACPRPSPLSKTVVLMEACVLAIKPFNLSHHLYTCRKCVRIIIVIIGEGKK
eukprot:6198611-Pleurochrysis_carterae.AAC.1